MNNSKLKMQNESVKIKTSPVISTDFAERRVEKSLRIWSITIPLLIVGSVFIHGTAFANPIVCNPDGVCSGSGVSTPSIIPWVLALIFNVVVDAIVFFLTFFLLKIKRRPNKLAATLLVFILIGFMSDFIGLLASAFILSDANSEGLFALVSGVIVGFLILIGDSITSRGILKTNNKESLIIGLSMAVLTNPALWAIIFSIFKG